MKNIFSFYINSSIHVAIAVCAFVGVTIFEFDISITNDLLGFIFFGTITGYNFVKYAEITRFRHRSLNLSLRTIQVFSFFCFLALIYFTLKLPLITLLITGGFAALTFFYAIPFLNNKSLRVLVGIKILIVAVVWAGVTVIIPMVNENELMTNTFWISFIQRVLFVVALAIPFEIRDLKYDEMALGTLPQLVGVLSTKIVGVVLIILSFLTDLFKIVTNRNHTISLGVISIILIVFIIFSNKKQTKYFASFWVENIPIMWLVLFYLLLR